MRKAVRWIGRGVFALLLLFALVLAVYRLRGPSAAQREALALLQQDQRPTHGRGAFPLLWYLPYDVPLDQVEARTAADVDRCAEMAGEFGFQQAIVRQIDAQLEPGAWWSRWSARVLFESTQTQAWFAEPAARHCGAVASARMLADRPLGPTDEVAPLTHRLECVSSLVGCILADTAAPAYADYDRRTLDFAAHLRLAATASWLHETPRDVPLAGRFAQRLRALRSEGHVSGFDAERGVLFIDNLASRRAAQFELPVAR